MIKDKHPAPQPAQPSAPAESLPEEVSANPFVEIYRAVKRAVLTLRENPDDYIAAHFIDMIFKGFPHQPL